MFMTACCEFGLLGFGRLLSHYFLFRRNQQDGVKKQCHMRLEKKNDIVLLLQYEWCMHECMSIIIV